MDELDLCGKMGAIPEWEVETRKGLPWHELYSVQTNEIEAEKAMENKIGQPC